MKKFLLGIFVGLVLSVLTGVVVVFSMIRLGETKPTVSDGSTLILRLEGSIPEKSPVTLPYPFSTGPEPITVQEIWTTMRRASTDTRIKAMVIEMGRIDAGWAKIQEIRQNIVDFRKSGKPVYAFLKYPGMREYYVATAAERLYTIPEDMVDVKGLRAEMLFFKNTLDKIGVRAQVLHVGKYKDAGDMLTENAMSPATRESVGLLLDGLYQNALETMAAGRKKSVDEIRTIVDGGPYTSKQALAKGLLDALRYQDQVYGEMKDLLKSGELKRLTFRDYMKSLSPEKDAKKRVALITGEGTILRGSGDGGMGSDEAFVSGPFIRILRQVREDKNISGVILRVDSPGGDAFASDEMLREVRLLRDKKPMVISMSDSAASGGYYVSMTGDPIVAYPNTVTGSIGVLYTSMDVKGLYDKLGISREVMARGKNADIDSGYGPLSPEARQRIQDGLDEFYKEFVGQAATARRKKYDELEPLAQGRVWLGTDARARGLVDELGGLDKAMETLRKRAKWGADEKLRVVSYPPKRTLLDQFLRSASESASVESMVDSKLAEMLGFDPRVLMRSGYMRLAPFRLDVR